MNRDKLKAELIRDEEKRLHAYRDSVGLYTIGVGHLLGETPRLMDITEEECENLLEQDIDKALKVSRRWILSFDSLDDVRQRALANMAFNLGNRLGGFEHMLMAIEAKDWALAATSALASKWAEQVGERAVRLAKIIETGKDAV